MKAKESDLYIECAGLLVYRTYNNNIQFLLAHPTGHKKGRYCIPKGHIEKNELPLKAAIRETFEETGVKAIPVAQWKYKISYPFENKIKFVTFFLAEYVSGVNNDGVSSNHDWENDDVRFFNINSLPEIYSTQQQVIDSAHNYISTKYKNAS